MARAQVRTERRLRFGELPDSASSERNASTSESDSEDFDYGAFLDRPDQRDQIVPHIFTSHNTIVVSKAKPILATSLVGTFTTFVGSNRFTRFVVAGFLGLFHRSPFSVGAALVPLAQQMAKRSHPFTDEASKYSGASSMSKPEGKRVLALASVRHTKSSPLISAQEKTQSDIKGQENPGQASGDQPRMVQQSDDPSQENPGQASGDRLHFTGSTRHPEVTEPEA